MTDDQVAELLKSKHPLVMIEAPAGCGKTYQAANFAAHEADHIGAKKILTLTHTHAACSVIAERTELLKQRIDIRTLDSFIYQIANAYRIALGLSEDIAAWVRSTEGSHEQLANMVSNFVVGNPIVSGVLAQQYPVIICDEHQDSSVSQERLLLAICNSGARVRIFGDPMQVIPGGRKQNNKVADVLGRWAALKEHAVFGELGTPHRWKSTNPALGAWVLQARIRLRDGKPIDLSKGVVGRPDVLVAENTSIKAQSYRFSPSNCDWAPINVTINQNTAVLCVAGLSATVNGLRSTFKQRLPIWEGHTRNELENLIVALSAGDLTSDQVSTKFVEFLQAVLTGFGATYTKRFRQEIEIPTANPRGTIPPQMAVMATMVRENPTHVGLAMAAAHLRDLISAKEGPFGQIRIDRPKELDDLIKIGRFVNADEGLAEIKQRRSRAHPKPPRKCLSTIHKSKGLEAHTTVIFGCDAAHFPDQPSKRNLLYVALSRASHRLVLIRSEDQPSPLLAL
ncbi:ATP-dependent helicase [Pelagicoccus sp. SDUM812002]|uniref:ATP-dependent helicase n=1 Tax=Pelagicoccus sp. SDUM812002 TaxID=3041266 RepID=UPI00280D1819|nr:ATP-dependent helicase [Pelagicoccus sp. SDUM812002]MDQ8188480.1 ATP-dependent helicase [Pelagicoccus sp. SDUM812002]